MNVAKSPTEFICKAQCNEPAIKIINTHSNEITECRRHRDGIAGKLCSGRMKIQAKIVGSRILNKDFVRVEFNIRI